MISKWLWFESLKYFAMNNFIAKNTINRCCRYVIANNNSVQSALSLFSEIRIPIFDCAIKGKMSNLKSNDKIYLLSSYLIVTYIIK